MSQNQRMILAVVLSIIFFVVYDTYFMPKANLQDMNQTKKVTQKTINKVAPAPQTSSDTVKESIKTPNTKSKTLVTIKSKKFSIKVDSLGRILEYTLLGEKFKKEDGTYTTIIKDNMELKPLEVRFSDNKLNTEAFATPYSADKSEIDLDKGSQTVVLTQKLSSNIVTKKITFNQDGTYKVEVSLEKPSEFFISNGEHPVAERDKFVFNGVIVEKNDDTLEKVESGKSEGSLKVMDAKFLASNDKYYTTVFYDFDKGLDVVVSTEHEDPKPFVKVESGKIDLNGYIGPKDFDKLKAIDPRLTNVIEYGFFTFIAKPMFLFLKYIYGLIGNWGWTIVIATIIIKLVLFPLTFKGMVSMNKMKELSPKVKEIQAKYKGEPQKMNAKMMELYKKHGANPMGGCLPMIMQIPVFFAIYRVLLNSFELKQSAWILWYHDLSAMDPYYVLPLLMGATMFWQQHVTPQNYTDPMQAKIMKFLPLIFTFFFVTFPAGLTLYWFVNNLFSVGQQYYVNAIFKKAKENKKG